MKKILSVIALMACTTGVASAADVPLKPYAKAPAPMATGWTGFYAGANIGYAWQDPTVTITPLDPASNSLVNNNASFAPIAPRTSFDIEGITGGFHVGYNRQFSPNWLVGIETDFSASSINGGAGTRFVGMPGIFNLPFGTNSREEVTWFGTVRARAGWLATPDLLLFGTGGLAYGLVRHTTAITNQAPGGLGVVNGNFNFGCAGLVPCFENTSWRVATGWTAGGGVEYALTRSWTAKVEYLYVNLGSDFFNIAASNPGGNAQFKVSYTDTHFNLVRLGASYRF